MKCQMKLQAVSEKGSPVKFCKKNLLHRSQRNICCHRHAAFESEEFEADPEPFSLSLFHFCFCDWTTFSNESFFNNRFLLMCHPSDR